MDRIRLGVAGACAARVVSAQLATATQNVAQDHELSPAGAQLLAELMISAALLSGSLDDDQRLTLQLRSERPGFSAICEVTWEGHLRARMTPGCPAQLSPLTGELQIVTHDRCSDFSRESLVLRAETLSSALARHVDRTRGGSAYLASAVQLGPDGAVEQAAGILVERLSSAAGLRALSPEMFQALYSSLPSLGFATLLASIRSEVLLGQPLLFGEEIAISRLCECSQERAESTLLTLDPSALQDLLREPSGMEVSCHFCSTRFSIPPARIEELLHAAQARGDC